MSAGTLDEMAMQAQVMADMKEGGVGAVGLPGCQQGKAERPPREDVAEPLPLNQACFVMC